jgi:drug/metabolite transporter (DMT)-like permease
VTATRVFVLTVLAMIAFAGTSLLCRVALRENAIDPASFTLIRLAAGAMMLCAIALVRNASWRGAGSWPSGMALFGYAAAFSFAYVSLSAGTGALLLFGAVQATMILWGWWRGERLHARQFVGLALAVAGLVALVSPGLSAPPFVGSVLMIGAGFAWGVYSLRGKAAGDPVDATTGNFIRAVPFAIALALAFAPWLRADAEGVGYAILSGAIASGLGYVIWYSVLPSLRPANAATVQLSVPVLTALAGILLLGEPLTLRFFIAAVAILGGIALVVISVPSRDVQSKHGRVD